MILFYAAVAFFLAYFLINPVRELALKLDAVAQPGGRHIHQIPIPKLGGLAIFGSFLVVIALVLIFNPELIEFIEDDKNVTTRNIIGVGLAGLLLVITGIYDDINDLKPAVKLVFQLIASILIIAFGIKIQWISHPFDGPNIILGNWNYLIVPAWLLFTTNAMNWFDGVDGLAGGLSVIAAITLGILSLDPSVNQPATALLAFVLAGATLGFLPFNWHPAKIFLGDTGSMFLGFMIGVFAIISGAKLATAALVLGIPILDALWVIVRRLLAKKPVWQADKKHLHHRLLDIGLSPKATTLLIYGVASFFGIIALASGTEGKILALGWLVAVMVIMGLVLVILAKRKKNGQKSS